MTQDVLALVGLRRCKFVGASRASSGHGKCGERGRRAADAEVNINYVRPRRPLCNTISHHEVYAQAVVDAVHAFNPDLSGAVAGKKAMERNLTSLYEAFADHTYNPDGALVHRWEEGAALHEPNAITESMIRLAIEGTIIARYGYVMQVHADSVCIHGDAPGCFATAGAMRAGLEEAGVTVGNFV